MFICTNVLNFDIKQKLFLLIVFIFNKQLFIKKRFSKKMLFLRRMNIAKKHFTLFYFACILLGVIGLGSCAKDEEGARWDVDVLAPLIKSSLSIKDLISDTLLVSNPDSSVKLVYNTTLINFSSDTLAQVPDTVLKFSSKNTFAFPLPYSGGQMLINKKSEIDFPLGGIELDKAKMKTQLIRFYAENKMNAWIVVEYKIPSASLAGVPFQIIDSVPPRVNATTPGVFDVTKSLAGYDIDLTGITFNKTNIVVVDIKAYVSKAVSTISVANADSLYILNSSLQVKPSYAHGYLGQNSIVVGPESVDFSLFKEIKSGTFKFSDVNIKLELENNIGVEARANISKLTSTNTAKNSSIDLISSAVINKNINVNRATEMSIGNPPPTPAIKILDINSTNSNINALLENMPDKLTYQMKVDINPLGNVSGSNDFVYTDYGIKAKLNMEIPLRLATTNILLQDTIGVDLSSINKKDSDKINGGYLYLYANNGMPLDATLQLYLLNNNLTITDSLLIPTNNTVVSGLIGTNNKVTQASVSKLAIPVTKDKINKILSTKKILVKALFNTANQPNTIYIYSHYKIDFKVIADINYRLGVKN